MKHSNSTDDNELEQPKRVFITEEQATLGKDAQKGATFNLDEFIQKLATKAEKATRPFLLKESDLLVICQRVKNLFMTQPMLLPINGPIKICADIHGQFKDLMRVFELCGSPRNTKYLFLGDYVDRGKMGIETISLLFAYKLRYPNTFHLLRGNHECQAVSRIYGFFDECKRRFDLKLWKTFIGVFDCMPVAAIVENQIFCCHGGLSPDMFKNDCSNLEQLKNRINALARPTDVPDEGLLCDLLWSDPRTIMAAESPSTITSSSGFAPNQRGVSYVFSPEVVDRFLARFNLDLVIRGHQIVEDGYEFFADRSFVTIFTAPNYCGEFDNAGAVFSLNRVNRTGENGHSELEGSFQILQPELTLRKTQTSITQ
ncbi:hypothetical protein Ciccas_004132 [Cichlidogyrus casuarinus]|uniref:Serine/threonine-protein phosphatase n=1 Tax=Cichlidogyrus casuarinus TaxID=1844966 RepID=A0ABD2QEQ4_9PLAT